MKAINRVIHYIDNKGINNSSFEKMCGLSNGYLGTQLKRNADLGEGVLNKILDNCLDVSPEWLLTGRGEMLKSEGATEVIKTPPVEIIAPIKVEGRSLMPKVIVLKDEDVEEERIPLVPVMAQAGYLQGYDDPQYIKELPMYNLPGMRNGTFRIFQVEGLSMYPTLQSGSYVVGQFVEDWEHISDNRIYVVVSTEGVIVKRVLNRIEKYGSLYCKSDNRVFPHINVRLKDVKEIWECKMHLSFDFLDPVPEYQKIADLEADVQFLKQRVEQLEEEKTQVL
jgi:putative phage repressor|uniref:Putative transcriptional regulator n=1 Tax=Myoviridae sp. ct1Js5 TaxID=2826601 RepID=A0A8S5M8X4_9CAUD|nr:MAG TPA: putative transcriptional regulator [Myoviridae sp. ct1Js5]